MRIQKYLAEVEKSYHYRIKTIVPLDDDKMGRIEHAILKYNPLSLSQPNKTIIQKNPLDFPSIVASEVYIVDVELGLPASAYVMQQELRMALGIPEDFIVVVAPNDPIENQTIAANAKREMDKEARNEGASRAALMADPHYSEAPEIDPHKYFGDEFNRRLLGYLKRVEEERKEAMKIDAPHPLIRWKDMPKSDVPADPGPTIGTSDGEMAETAPQGNFDDDKKTYRRLYQRNGNVYVKARSADSIRKVKK